MSIIDDAAFGAPANLLQLEFELYFLERFMDRYLECNGSPNEISAVYSHSQQNGNDFQTVHAASMILRTRASQSGTRFHSLCAGSITVAVFEPWTVAIMRGD